ncbi:MAG: error-prone DNA polymerase, partial [Comamonadaceae bacterium]
ISGGMVHPYLRARERSARGEPITYERSSRERGPKPRLQQALERTLGVPIFQEQVMEISMIAAGFTATQADSLRRAMAAWTRKGKVHDFHQQLVGGMLANGYSEEFAQRIFKQIEGFGEYGFPESHAYSFALLAYKSSWLKCHEPECFLAAMLNSQPMGFYAASQLVQDAQRNAGVRVLPADVSHSDWDASLESEPSGSDSSARPLVRLGLRQVGGLAEDSGKRIAVARMQAPFHDVDDLVRRAGLGVKDINALAAADALRSLAGHRRQQAWEAAAQRRAPALLEGAPIDEDPLALPAAPEGEEILFDYRSLGLSLRRHPLALLRERLQRRRVLTAAQLDALPDGRHVIACGIVTVRQRPGTAKGTMFVTMEDETGPINVIVWPAVLEAQRDALLRSGLLAVEGRWQRDTATGGLVRHLVAETCTDLTRLLGRLGGRSASRDFH